MQQLRKFAIVSAVALCVSTAFAQKNDIAVGYGRTFIGHQTIPGTGGNNAIAFGHGNTFDINYARLLKSGDLASIFIEVPVVFNPDEDLNYPSNLVPGNYSSYFITPSARVLFFPHVLLNPWASVGGGFGRVSQSNTLEFGGPNPNRGGNTVGVLQFGGGVDIKTWRSISVRGEIRDFYSGSPKFVLNTGKSRQHNLYIGVGAVWSFDRLW